MAMKPYTGEVRPNNDSDDGELKPYSGEVVSPKAPSDPQKRTWGETAKDTGLAATQMAGNLLGGLTQAANVVTGGEVDRRVVRPLEGGARALLGADPGTRGTAGLTADMNEAIDPLYSAKIQRLTQELGETEGFLPSAAKVLSEPALAGKMVAEQVPILALMGRNARAAGKRGRADALAGKKAPTAAEQLAAADAGQSAATGSIVRTSAAMGGGFASNEAVQRAMALPEETWAANPEYQALVAEGIDPLAAKEQIATRAALPSLLGGAGVNALASTLNAGMEARIFTGAVRPGGVAGLFSREGAKQVAKQTGLEALEEGVTEGGEQFSTNLGVQQIDPTQDLMAGVPEGAGAGAAMGGLIGGGMQAAGTALSKPAPAEPSREEFPDAAAAMAAPPSPPPVDVQPGPGVTVVDPADGPLSKAVATQAAADRGDGNVAPVVAPSVQAVQDQQQEQAQEVEDQKAALQDAPGQQGKTQKQAEAIATGGPAPVEARDPASEDEIRTALAPLAKGIIDANMLRTLAKALNVPVVRVAEARKAMRAAERAPAAQKVDPNPAEVARTEPPTDPGVTPPSSTTPAAGATAATPPKEAIREEGQDLFAGQEGEAEVQTAGPRAGGVRSGAPAAQEGGAQGAVGRGDAGREVPADVVPDAKLRKALKASRQATGADGAEYTVRAFSNGDGFYVTRKTDTGSTRHQSDKAAEPWSYERAADEAAKLAAQSKESPDGQVRGGAVADAVEPVAGVALGVAESGGRAPAAATVSARDPGRDDAGAASVPAGVPAATAEAPQVAEGDEAPAPVRAEQGEAAEAGTARTPGRDVVEAGAARVPAGEEGGDGGAGNPQAAVRGPGGDVRGGAGVARSAQYQSYETAIRSGKTPDLPGIRETIRDDLRLEDGEAEALFALWDNETAADGELVEAEWTGATSFARDRALKAIGAKGLTSRVLYKNLKPEKRKALGPALRKALADMDAEVAAQKESRKPRIQELTKEDDARMAAERAAAESDDGFVTLLHGGADGLPVRVLAEDWNRPGIHKLRTYTADGKAKQGFVERKDLVHPNATAPEHVGADTGVSVDELKEIAASWREHIDGGGDAEVTRIFDAPAKKDIVRLEKKAGITETLEPDPKRPGKKMKVYHRDAGWMTVEEAQARIREWEDNAVQQGKGSQRGKNANSQKVVLSFFDLTGEWSIPWEQAGYQVYRFDIQDDSTFEYTDEETGETEERKVGDVNNMSVEYFNDLFGAFEGNDVYAILAACPCTDFAVSGARHFAAKDADGRTVASVELVKKTLAAIEYFKPAVWAVENPVGRIEDLTGMPPWRLSFQPFHLGDNYTKKTLLWGRFNGDLPIAPVSPNLADGGRGGMIHQSFGGKSMATKNARSATPEGFAYGFFQANNAVDHPAMALSWKYDRLDATAIKAALDAGVTPQEVSDLVDDPYYFDLDDEAANTALREAAAGTNEKLNEERERRQREAAEEAALRAKPAKKKAAKPTAGDKDDSQQDAVQPTNPVEAAMQARGMRKTGPLRWVTAGGKNAGTDWRELVMDSDTAFVIYAGERNTARAGSLDEALAILDAPKPDDGQQDELDAEMRSYEAKADKPKPAASANTIFTEDAAAAARALLKKKLGQLNTGIDPEMLQAGLTLAGYHIEKGARTFAAYAAAMVEDLGDAVRPYLKSWYMAVKYDPRASTFAAGMDAEAAIDAADVDRRHDPERARIDALPEDERDAEIRKLRGEVADLKQKADTDARTGIKGPGAYDRDKASAGGIAAIDLTLFKGYNTLLTDAGGDVVLSVFGDAMREAGGDAAYRRGGDEFAFLADSPAEAKAMLAKLEDAVSRIEITLEGADGATYIISGVPFAAGVGAYESQANLARDRSKTPGDRNALPANVRRVDDAPGPDEGGTPAPRRQRKAPAEAGRTLKQKWPDGITSDGSRRDDGGGPGTTKHEFLTDAKGYLNAVAKGLEARGFSPPTRTDRKGKEKTEAPVYINEGGRAVSGEVYLNMQARGGDVRVQIEVTESMSGGNKPSIRMTWADPGRTGFNGKRGGDGPNEWLSPITAVSTLVNTLGDRLDALDAGVTAPGATMNTTTGEPVEEQEDERDSESARGADDGESGAEGTGAGEVLGDGEGRGTDDLFGLDGASDRGKDRGAGRSGSGPAARRKSAGKGEGSPGYTRRGDLPRARRDAVDGKPGSRNFLVPLGGLTREGSWLESAKRNLDAIELALTLEKEGRPATPEEQAVLSKYVGFGASEPANKLFNPRYGDATKYDPELITEPGWREVARRLKAVLTPDQLATVMRSTQYAHYTSETVTRGIWTALERMGFDGGKVLEPGMGHGNFPMTAPADLAPKIAYTGVEMDHLTAAIGRHLVQSGLVLRADYTKQKLPNDAFDIAVGNPPFASTVITADPDYRKYRFKLHDYFFAKTIDKVRPGGLLVFVTSAGTMNKGSEDARQYIADRADLLGAIRLPDTAFLHNAGTEVVTDILFLRKRLPGEAPGGEKWIELAPVDAALKGGGTQEHLVNEYFAAHPEMVLGEHSMTGKMYGRPDLYNVKLADGQKLEDLLPAAIAKLPAGIYTPGEAKRDRALEAAVVEADLNPSHHKEGGLYVKDGNVMVVRSGAGKALASEEKLSARESAWLKDAIALRDQVKTALHDQRTDGDWQASLKALRTAYEAFVEKNGRINEFTESERKTRYYIDDNDREVVLKDEQEPPPGFEAQESTVVTRRYKNKRLLAMDVESPMLMALEHEGDDGALRPGAGLSQRSIQPPAPPKIESTHDALIVTLNRKGYLDVDMVADLAGASVEQTIAELGERIYQDPIDGQWTMADAYLSGDVVTKLDEAEAAAVSRPEYRRNVDALRAVQPAPLTPRDITVGLGMTWLDPDYVNQFAREVLNVPNAGASYDPKIGQWNINSTSSRYERQRESDFGHKDRSAAEILDAVINNRELKVSRSALTAAGNKTTVTDPEATTALNEIAKRMRARFKAWVWEDADRAQIIAKRYNDLRNRIIPRTFTGDFIDPPGLALQFKPDAKGKGGLHPHQKRAIWRIIQTGTTYLAHAVGAGKTLEMIIAGMEQKRLGLISKPMYTVPNHMLAQFAGEFLEAYPTANIMVADEENFQADKRRQFVAAATLNSPDAIIITHSALRLLRVKPETMRAVTDDMRADLEAALKEIGNDDRITRKKLEAQLEKLEQRVAGKSDDSKQDNVVFFEDMGVDFLFVDEAHEFRKLDFVTNRTNVKGISPEGSAKALDLYAKVRHLAQQRPGRSHAFASGTPVTNTMGELYTVQKFMDYDAMREAGLHHFDAWASEYGEVATEYERNAAGQYKPVERFARFNNVPELMQQVRERMDVLTSSQLGELVKRPDLEGGQPAMIVVEPSEDLTGYMRVVLAQRIKESLAWKPSPDEPANPDPMLAIIGDARLAVIDMRFIDPTSANDPNSKLNRMVDRIIDMHGEFADVQLYQEDGSPLPGKGATQIVFSPIGFGAGVAKSRGFDARAWMNKRFREAGIPLEQVAWMSDYDTSRKRKAVFREMRAGRVRILIGSPANMGTGVNVQTRLKHLHYLSPPWFPSDVEQPHGRILRQKNLNPEVGISWYVTEGTYDSTGWGMVARKGKFIESVMRGEKGQRNVEDISEVSSYALASALASGDDRAVKVAELEADIGRLNNLQTDHERSQRDASNDIWAAKNKIEAETTRQKQVRGALEVLGDTVIRADTLALAMDGKPLEGERSEASVALMKGLLHEIPSPARLAMTEGMEKQVGTINGYPLILSARAGIAAKRGYMSLDIEIGPMKVPVIEDMAIEQIPLDASGALGITTRMMNAINGLQQRPAHIEAALSEAHDRLARAEKKRKAPFPQEAELFEKVAELARLQKEMADESAAAEAAANAQPSDQTQPPDGPAPAASAPEPGARASGPSETSLGVKDLTRAMQAIVRSWTGDAPKVVYLQAATELPAAAKRADGWFDAEGWYDGKDTVYLVADNLPNVTRAAQVLAHEAFGHYGVEGIVGKGAWAQIVADVAKLRATRALGKDMKAAMASAERRYGTENPVQFAREFLAIVAERGLRTSMLGRVLGAVRRWLRSLGFKIDAWAEDEIRAIVAKGIRSVERGGTPGGGSRGTRGAGFSEKAPVFYSALAESVQQGQGAPKKADAAAWKGWLDGAVRRGEFKQAERDWLGVDAWLDGRGTTTREDLAAFVRQSEVQVQDVVLGESNTSINEAFERSGYRIEYDVEQVDYIDPDGEYITFDDLPAHLQRVVDFDSKQTVGLPAKFASHTLPGGENYRELLLTLPDRRTMETEGFAFDYKVERAMREKYGRVDPRDWTFAEAEAMTNEGRASDEAFNRHAERATGLNRQTTFTSSHFGQPNVLAHVRFNERTDADGKRVLFIEEIQSDWHQKGRKQGYGKSDAERAAFAKQKAEYDRLQEKRTALLQRATNLPEGPEFDAAMAEAKRIEIEMRPIGAAVMGAGAALDSAAVPAAPFKGTDEWAMLAFKRMARWAVDNGFDRIAWTTGEQQNARYDLAKQVDHVSIYKESDGTYTLEAFGKNNTGLMIGESGIGVDRIEALVGKDLAEKASKQPEGPKEYRGVDLKIGGEGMKGFYDKILPTAVNKWAKKFGGKVGRGRILSGQRVGDNAYVQRSPTGWRARWGADSAIFNTEAEAGAWLAEKEAPTVHALDITPAMREAVAEGQPLFSLKDPGAAIDAMSAALANPKKLATDKLADWKPALLGLLTLDQLAEIGKDEAPQVKEYAKGVLRMQTRRNQLQEGSAKLADRWQAWQRANREPAEKLAGVMHDATIAGTDPAKAYLVGEFALHTGEKHSLTDVEAIQKRITLLSNTAKAADKLEVMERLAEDRRRLLAAERAEKERAAAYPGLVRRFNALPDEAKALYRDVRDEYAARSEATMDALLARVNGLGLPEGQRASLSDKIRTMFEAARVTAPYFPLARFGEYWVSAKKGTETTFHMAETKAERDELVADLKADGWKIAARGVKLDTVKARDGASGAFVSEVIARLDLAGVDEDVQDEIYQLYLRTLPDLSVRKNFIHRKKVKGYAADALRAFAGHMNHGAHQLARLEHTRDLEAAIDALRKAAKDASNEDDDVADRLGRMFNELQKRHEWVVNPKDASWVQKASSASFIWYLGVTPAAALINLLQTATVTFPALAARHGAMRALEETSKAMAAAIRTGGNIDKTAANAQEKQALQALQDMGAIDKTLAHDLAGIGDADSREFSPLWRKTMKVVSFLFHKAEVINREASGLAAFRMAIQDGKTFEEAVDAAAETIHETHFNYSNANRARFMQGNAAKVIFAFKQYSQNMTFFLWRNLYKTMKGASPAERNEARNKLMGTLGMTALFSGAMGMPLLSVMFGIANAMAAAFGDDDEPWDAETEFRNFLADMLGPELGRIAQVGALQGGLSALGLPAPSISERLSLNNLWFRDPDQELEGRDLYHYWLEQVAGPVGGMFASAFAGAATMREGLEKGDPGFLWRGVETSMPKAVKDGMRAARYATQGVNTMRGDPLIEDTTLGEWMLQASGFTPARVSEAYEVNRAVKGYEKAIEDRRSTLLDAFALATRQRDAETIRAVTQKIRTFNAKHPRMAISMETIRRSLTSRASYSEKAVNGIVVSDRVPEAREAGRFFAEAE